jgi:Icc-related predicted phosphoesterase
MVGAGDFATVRRDLHVAIDVLKTSGKPTVLVPGNAETFDELRQACAGWSGAHVLHGSSTVIDGVTFYGVGGGIPVTPFGAWSFDFTEEQAAELLADCPPRCVLVTHSPPQGAVDVSSLGRSLGSVAIRHTIETQRPLLAVCGHIHESAGREEWIGSTPVVNAGPRGVAWQLRR